MSKLNAGWRKAAISLACGVSFAVLGSANANALSIEEAMTAAYRHNPEMKRERSNLRSAKERYIIARGQALPNISVDLNAGRSEFESDLLRGATPDGTVNLDPRNARVLVDQPLFNGGGIVAGIKAADRDVDAAGYLVIAREQSILRAVANAYVDALLNKSIVDLNKQNVDVLTRQRDATIDRREAGLLTPTDVAQADARLARSRTALVDAEVRFNAAQYDLEQLVGLPADELDDLGLPEGIPGSLETALELMLAQHPSILAASETQKATEYSITAARGAYMPRLSVQGQYSYNEEKDRPNGEIEERLVQLALTMPLFQGGADHARVRDARIQHNISRLDVSIIRRQLITATRNAWSRLVAARAAIDAAEAQKKASARALEGVRREAKLGSRTTLDVLDAEQELLEAEVTLRQGHMEEVRAAYDLLELTGTLTAAKQGFEVEPHRALTSEYPSMLGEFFSDDPMLNSDEVPFERMEDYLGEIGRPYRP